jgi:hypothetical protein
MHLVLVMMFLLTIQLFGLNVATLMTITMFMLLLKFLKLYVTYYYYDVTCHLVVVLPQNGV